MGKKVDPVEKRRRRVIVTSSRVCAACKANMLVTMFVRNLDDNVSTYFDFCVQCDPHVLER